MSSLISPGGISTFKADLGGLSVLLGGSSGVGGETEELAVSSLAQVSSGPHLHLRSENRQELTALEPREKMPAMSLWATGLAE